MPASAVSVLRSLPILCVSAFILVIASGRPIRAGDVKRPQAPSQDASPLPAQAPRTDTSRAKEARIALNKAIEFHRQARDLSLKFKASVYNASLEKKDRYEGKLLLKGASKFRVEIPGGIYVSDGETYWEYHAKNHQVLEKRARDMEDRPLPGDVLLRFLDSDPISMGKAVEGGKEFVEMRLDPSRAMKNLDSLAVLLDKRDYSVHRISSRDVSGNEAEYTVTSVKRNVGIKDKEFTFAIPKGAEVVDMRE